MKISLRLTLYFFLITGLISSTDGQKAKTVNNIKIIQNKKKPQPPRNASYKVSFELELIIGESDDPDQSFSEVSNFVVDDDMTLYALDFKDRKVKVFDDAGRFVRSFGKQGQGPGELQMPAGIHLTSSNELIVEDAMGRKLVYFTKEGTFIKEVSFADKMALVNILMGPKGNFIGRELKLDGQKVFFEIKKLDPGLKSLFPLDQIEFALPVPGSGKKINLMDMLSVYQFDSSGHIYYGRNLDYEIKVYTPDGTHVKSIQKEYEPQKVTKEDIEEILDRMPNMGAFNPREMFEFPKLFPSYQSFILDKAGRIFVRTWEKGKNKGEYIFDVFDAEGRYIYQFPSKMDIRLWKNEKAYSYEENEEELMIIKMYKAKWER